MRIAGLVRTLLVFWHRFVREDSGATVVLSALAMTATVGFVSLGTEAGTWYLARRGMQGAADHAALSAAAALAAGGGNSAVANEARSVSAANSYANGAANTTVTVNSPPASGAQSGNSSAVEVIVQQTKPLLFAGLFLGGPVTISSRSVALNRPSGVACVLGLDPSASGTVSLGNNASMPNPACGIADNSSSATALTVSNNATVAGPVSVTGTWSVATNAALLGAPNLENAYPVADPYAGVTRQAAGGCTLQSGTYSNGAIKTLTAGHFCNGFNMQNNVQITLTAGYYYIDTQLVIANNAQINATGGVTLVIQGNYAINLGNNAQINITAPTSGPYAGIAIFGDRNGTKTVQQTFSNNTQLNIQGAIYFPNQIIQFDNNVGSGPSACTQVIGRIVNMQNNVQLGSNCAGTGTIAIPIGIKSVLVE
ncbi:MAG: hypothetical protein JWO51_1179 [Rhodospirillales bacterium]|nr:hypothetical protein [Rhodospirillales bacterium]